MWYEVSIWLLLNIIADLVVNRSIQMPFASNATGVVGDESSSERSESPTNLADNFIRLNKSLRSLRALRIKCFIFHLI